MLTFDDAIRSASTPEEAWLALQQLTQTLVGVKLFTVMTVDMQTLQACRVYTNDPIAYPVSGTKPITIDDWFDVVHRQQKMFVANTITEIAKVFPDHEKIWSLGCGSVVNLPVIIGNELVATINILHEQHHYTPARIQTVLDQLTEPARLAYQRTHLVAPQSFDLSSKKPDDFS